jgi:hypothetical protein
MIVGEPTFSSDEELASVVKNVTAQVRASADAISACGGGVGASSGSIELAFGLEYDVEGSAYYRISENTTGNRALGTCLRGVAKTIAEVTKAFDPPDGDGDFGEGFYDARVRLTCAAAK